MSDQLDLNLLRSAVAGRAAAFRCVTNYQPAGGPGDKVFPPTYSGGKYAVEDRIDPKTGEIQHCVLLDSVQSQANRMELALLEAHRRGELALPLLITRFDQDDLCKKFVVTSLEAPHRAADAIFRDSMLGGKKFRESDEGGSLDKANIRNATGLFGICPTALVFGLWDSTGPRGGLGAKFPRALVSEIVGYNAVPGVKTASRIDPAAIEKRAGPIFRTEAGDWTLDADRAKKIGDKPILYKLRKGEEVPYDPKETRDIPDEGRPSVINQGNVTPDYDFARDSNNQKQWETRINSHGKEEKVARILGGFTISKATQTTVLSLNALRRLHFPLGDSGDFDHEADVAARTALAALGLAAGTLVREDGDLRSRCQLFANKQPVWKLLDRPGKKPKRFELSLDASIELLKEAIVEVKRANLPWLGEIELTPSDDLVELVRLSQEWPSPPGKDGD